MGDAIWHMTKMACGKCGIEFAVPDHFYREQLKDGPNGGWYCPNGHSRVFGESEGDKLRRERDRLKQEAARLEDEKREAIARAERAEKTTKRLQKRASAGVCPCCNRTFQNMARHMKTKHPNIVPLEQKSASEISSHCRIARHRSTEE